MEEKTDNITETKLLNFNGAIENFVLTVEKDSSIRKINSWIEVQPKKRARSLGSKFGFNLRKGYFNLGQVFVK